MLISLKTVLALLFSAHIYVLALSAGISADMSGGETPAVVVYKIDGRIYLSLGRLAGISGNWLANRVSGGVTDLREPLTWLGDDLCRIEPSAEIARTIEVGDTLWMAAVMLPDSRTSGKSVRWALTRLPLPVDRAPVGLIDWDFREALYSRHGEFVERIEVDESGNSVWHLWPDKEMRFSNGKSVDADAIIESLRWLCNRKQPFSVWTEHFDLVDDSLYCVKSSPFNIQTDFPSYCGRQLSGIDAPGFYLIDVGSPDAILHGYAIGSGAYRIADMSDSLIILCGRRDLYSTCSVDTIVLQLYDSYEAAKLAFELGEADIIEIAPYDVKKFENSYQVMSETLNAAVFLSVNNSRPYFADNLFATAVSYLVDKESLCRVPLAQMVTPIDFVPVLSESSITLPFAHDPRKGRKLLHQIDDLPEFMSLLVMDPNDPAMVRAAEYIRGILARENILVTVYDSPYSAGSSEDETFIGSFDMMIARLEDPAGTGAQFLYQSYFHGDFGRIQSNRSLFHSSEIEQLFRESFTSCFGNTEAGKTAMRRIAYIHLNTPSGVWLYRPTRYIAVSQRVVSLEFLSGGIVDFTRIEVEKQ